MKIEMTTGRRIYPNEKGEIILQAGDYVKDQKGYWIIKSPNGIVASTINHEVIEHEDGTITVSPSIVVNGIEYDEQFMMLCEEKTFCQGTINEHSHEITWHGFLEKSIWREV